MSRYHIRRTDREIADPVELDSILRAGRYMTVALCARGEPYVVTLSYGWEASARRCWFHCAPKGRKIDAIRENPAVCATVIDDRGYRAGECLHAYRSAVLWGRISIVQDPAEKRHGLSILFSHLETGEREPFSRFKTTDRDISTVGILRLDVDAIDGKGNVPA
jgi:nitroimidazol reductase NimA-like FMN-containing flavoprotein (pyridoxamine 5'-phosphate oxidase superfamily)